MSRVKIGYWLLSFSNKCLGGQGLECDGGKRVTLQFFWAAFESCNNPFFEGVNWQQRKSY